MFGFIFTHCKEKIKTTDDKPAITTDKPQKFLPTPYGQYPDTLDVDNVTGAEGRKWFNDAKFGVFIHYLIGHRPKIKTIGKSDIEAVKADTAFFGCQQFNAVAMAKRIKAAGATYAVLTTKHHIGFALFDIESGNFTAKKCTDCQRDLLTEYADALRAEGLKVGLYYSLPDWSHPDYASLTDKQTKNMGKEIDPKVYSTADDTVRWNRFVKQMYAELTHLCTHYGKIDLIWFDGDWERRPEEWHSYEIQKLVQKLQPHIIINNRLRHASLGHYGTPEQAVPLAPPAQSPWELCLTPGDNWDGELANVNLKPTADLIRTFNDVWTMGGNVLINIAPNSFTGNVEEIQWAKIDSIGRWVNQYHESVFGTEPGLAAGLFSGASAVKGNVLYLKTYDKPQHELVVKGIEADIKQITVLGSNKPLSYRYSGGFKGWGQKGWLYIHLPESEYKWPCTVVKVEFANDTVAVKLPNAGNRLLIKNTQN